MNMHTKLSHKPLKAQAPLELLKKTTRSFCTLKGEVKCKVRVDVYYDAFEAPFRDSRAYLNCVSYLLNSRLCFVQTIRPYFLT